MIDALAKTVHGFPADLHLFCTVWGTGAPLYVEKFHSNGTVTVRYLFIDITDVVEPDALKLFIGFNEEGKYLLSTLEGERAVRAARYLNCVAGVRPADIHNMMGSAYPDPSASQMEETMADDKTLYQVIGEERYGEHIATNSTGDLVLEMKGENGKVETFPKAKVKEVLPYTCVIGGAHWEVPVEAGLEEGDLLLFPEARDFLMVEKVDSQSKRRNQLPRGVRKIASTKIT